jgi:hypothetical protein
MRLAQHYRDVRVRANVTRNGADRMLIMLRLVVIFMMNPGGGCELTMWFIRFMSTLCQQGPRGLPPLRRHIKSELEGIA